LVARKSRKLLPVPAHTPAPSSLDVERRGHVAIWTIRRPEVRNALDFATLAALTAAVADATLDRALRAVVLTGAGSTFVSGGDLRELRTATTRAHAARLADAGRRVCDGMARLAVPVIAALTGPAIGGGAELALACDMRIADPQAKLSFKHGRMAVTTAWGLLPKLVGMLGHGMATRMLLTGYEIGSVEALRVGLVDAVSEPGQSVETAVSWADDVARASPRAIAGLKALLHDALDVGAPHRARERARFVDSWASPDHSEAVEAFFGRRLPVWQDR
jgi:enoyl-CoA hydratase